MLAALALVSLTSTPGGLSARLDRDADAGIALVAHVVVGLCDNRTQGISPVPPKLGDGRVPSGNLYWGAAYGVHTFLPKQGWKVVAHEGPLPDGVLERRVVSEVLVRNGRKVAVLVVADAYDGTRLPHALERFTAFSAGHPEVVRLSGGGTLRAGGDSHLVTFVGHNGLMDSAVPEAHATSDEPRGAAVLACLSRAWFGVRLETARASPVLMTNGLMAPEGYVVDALLRSFFEGRSTDEAAAAAYARYQKISVKSAARIFRPPGR